MLEAKVYATFRPLVGDSTVALETAPTTVGEAIVELSDRFPQLGERLLDEEGEPRSFVAIMVDGRDIRHTGGGDAAARGRAPRHLPARRGRVLTCLRWRSSRWVSVDCRSG